MTIEIPGKFRILFFDLFIVLLFLIILLFAASDLGNRLLRSQNQTSSKDQTATVQLSAEEKIQRAKTHSLIESLRLGNLQLSDIIEKKNREVSILLAEKSAQGIRFNDADRKLASLRQQLPLDTQKNHKSDSLQQQNSLLTKQLATMNAEIQRLREEKTKPSIPSTSEPEAKPTISKPMVSKPMVSKPMVSKPMVSKPMVSKTTDSQQPSPTTLLQSVSTPTFQTPTKPFNTAGLKDSEKGVTTSHPELYTIPPFPKPGMPIPKPIRKGQTPNTALPIMEMDATHVAALNHVKKDLENYNIQVEVDPKRGSLYLPNFFDFPDATYDNQYKQKAIQALANALARSLPCFASDQQNDITECPDQQTSSKLKAVILSVNTGRASVGTSRFRFNWRRANKHALQTWLGLVQSKPSLGTLSNRKGDTLLQIGSQWISGLKTEEYRRIEIRFIAYSGLKTTSATNHETH